MKNTGFTMIELLATITILGILSVIAVTSVNFLIDKGKKNFITSQRNNLISAAKSYYQANRSKLPKDIGTSKSVSYGELKTNKFIGKMYASDKSTECNTDNTKVVVTMVDKNNYKYKGYLYCGNEHEQETTGDETAILDVTPSKIGETFTYKFDIDTRQPISGLKIQSYSYTVLKNGYNYVGPITEKVSKSPLVQTKSFVIDLSDAKQTNNFDYVVNVVYKYGNSVKTFVKRDKLSLNDNKEPKCINITSPVSEWGKGPQTIKFDCIDNADSNGYASGCQKDGYKVVLKTKADVDKYKDGVKIYDKAGNEGICDIKDKIRVDFEPPECPTDVKGYLRNSSTTVSSHAGLNEFPNNTWTNKWIYTEASGSVDNAVGIKDYGAKGVYYKVTTTGATENVTGLKQGYRNVSAEGISTVTYQACDKLDNCTTSCNKSYTAKIDRTAPTGTKATGYKKNNATNVSSNSGLTTTVASNTWSNKQLFVLANSATDSGAGGVYYKSKVGSSAYSNVGYQNVNNNGSTDLSFIACDKLNNCQSNATAYIAKVDTVAPNVNISTSNGGYTITGTASDSGSGIGGFHWTGGSWVAASGTSISKSTNAATSNGVYAFYAKDAAGNENYRQTTSAYIRCSSKEGRTKNNDYPDCPTKHANISIYHWSYDSRDCSGSSYTRKYDFKQYSCTCYMDKKNGSYCSNSIENVTSCYHGASHSVIHYQHNDNGQAACKADKAVNSYVTRVCNSDDYSSTSGSIFQYHGYEFYEGAVRDWNGFSSGWTIGTKARPPANDSASAACAFACKKKYE